MFHVRQCVEALITLKILLRTTASPDSVWMKRPSSEGCVSYTPTQGRCFKARAYLPSKHAVGVVARIEKWRQKQNKLRETFDFNYQLQI